MNEARVVNSVKEIVLAASDRLVYGLTHQGTPRVIKQVTTSNLTPISGYYFILLYVTDVVEKTIPSAGKTTLRGSRITRYTVQMEVGDDAQVQEDDAEAYETMHSDFRTFTDRLADLIESNVYIGTNPKLMLERDPLNDRVVSKQNLSGTWQDTEGNGWASLTCYLRFNLVDGCGTTDLYD